MRPGQDDDPGKALNTGTIATTIIFSILAIGGTFLIKIPNPWGLIVPTIAGLLAGIVIGFTSDHYTDIDNQAVQSTAGSAVTGPAILIIRGFSYGLVSAVPSVIGIVVAMIVAWFSAEHFGVAGTYGVSIAAVGMLSITGMTSRQTPTAPS